MPMFFRCYRLSLSFHTGRGGGSLMGDAFHISFLVSEFEMESSPSWSDSFNCSHIEPHRS